MGEERTEKYYVRRREFLNEDPDLPAFIIGIVEDTRAIPDGDPDSRWNGGTITLDLADCYRRVCFDFSMYDAAQRANSLRKITLIAEVVNAVREGIAMEVESRNARELRAATGNTEPASAKPERAKAASATPAFTSHFTTLGL
ncbi:MAG TPA: hypothetical protein VNO50_06770 [Pyrinomonadaceae bacterium]|nr:hypothetical protein [Pyrinomonadaceae bacterium]